MLEEIQRTKQFKKDHKRLDRQGKNLERLHTVLEDLIDEKALNKSLGDHPLQGAMQGYRELHLEPDWLLVYKIEGRKLTLLRTGSHAELFGK